MKNHKDKSKVGESQIFCSRVNHA